MDGVLLDKAFYTPACWENDDLSCVEMEMTPTQYAVAFPHSGTGLKAQIDEFIREQTENGWLASLESKWFSKNEPTIQTPDLSQLTGENGVLRVATNSESRPFSYLKDGGVCGFDLDFIFKVLDDHSNNGKKVLSDFDNATIGGSYGNRL